MYLMPLIRQPECQVFTDKTSSSCNENSHTGPSPVYELIAPRLISSTIGGSSKALVSPRLEVSPSATFRSMRRMIFPERVLGNPRTNWLLSGLAMGPIKRANVAEQNGR